MIDLGKVKPGDLLSYKGRKCVVKVVHLIRRETLGTEVTGISVKMQDDYSEPCICPSGFKNLEYRVEEQEPAKPLNTRFVVTGYTGCVYKIPVTVGKIYEVKNGVFFVGERPVPGLGQGGFTTFSELNDFFKLRGVRVLEVVE